MPSVLEELLNQEVVIDLRSPYVCLGTLRAVHDGYLELTNADLHDLRDSDTTREIYVNTSYHTGIKRNRKRVFVVLSEVVAVSRLSDVVDV